MTFTMTMHCYDVLGLTHAVINIQGYVRQSWGDPPSAWRREYMIPADLDGSEAQWLSDVLLYVLEDV